MVMTTELLAPSLRVEFNRPADTVSYLGGDVVSNNAALNLGTHAPGYIVKAIFSTSVPSQVWRARLWLFSDNPVDATVTDNAPFTFGSISRDRLVGYVDMPSMDNLGSMSLAVNDLVRLWRPLSTVFVIVQTLDGFTPTASQTQTIILN